MNILLLAIEQENQLHTHTKHFADKYICIKLKYYVSFVICGHCLSDRCLCLYPCSVQFSSKMNNINEGL